MAAGFTGVSALKGGFAAWDDAGYRITKLMEE
jgi:rhodanese-related sulfurtransferase